MKTDPALALRIAAFEIDHGSPEFTFARRLARENSWDRGFAERVVREYLRFVYLASVSDVAVTPSVAVDQAWHLHLCYTRSYWTELCQQVLNRPLHHGPTKGGVEEGTRYLTQYEHTLGLYEREFGEAPPRDIWPLAAQRFAAAANPFWVSRDRFIVLDKSRVLKIGGVLGLALAGVLGAGASGSIPAVFILGLVLFFAVVIFTRRKSKGRKGGRGPGGCGASGCSGGADSGCGAGSGCGGGCGGD